MSEINYTKLEQALENLKEQYGVYLERDKQNFTNAVNKAIRNSVIKCFEICYDILWKDLKRFTQEKSGLPQIPNTPLPIFRTAYESGLIGKGMSERLINYNEMRGDTAHDYSMKKSEQVIGKIGDFIADTTELYREMTEE